MLTPLYIYALLILSILLAFLAIVLVNLAALPNLDDRRPSLKGTLTTVQSAIRNPQSAIRDPKLAVLVPARNEEANIAACLRSLLAQNYPNLEIWLYNDASTDKTGEIASQIAAEHKSAIRNQDSLQGPQFAISRLRIINCTEALPPGWLGKANACHRLYTAMRAESMPDYVLFTDADVRFDPHAVSLAVAAAQRLDAGLLSVFPRQITVSWAERVAVPILLHWAVYNFLPLPLAFTRRTGPAFAAANGQFMLFSRDAYEACGGHTTVRAEILEDVALARAVKKSGYRALLADAGPLVYTRMYNGPAEVWQGYSKNAYAFFSYSPFFLAIGIAVLLSLYVLPLLLALSFQPSAVSVVFLAQYVVGVLPRLALAVRFRYRLLDTLLHPVAIAYLIAIEINSMVWAITGRGNWKGRTVKSKE